jgi:hypothetical protein
MKMAKIEIAMIEVVISGGFVELEVTGRPRPMAPADARRLAIELLEAAEQIEDTLADVI